MDQLNLVENLNYTKISLLLYEKINFVDNIYFYLQFIHAQNSQKVRIINDTT